MTNEDILCKCGHPINKHSPHSGCQHVDRIDNCDMVCDCFETPQDIAAALQAERDVWRYALQSLTPGGSEFTEPQECFNYVREQTNERWASLKHLKVQLDELNAALKGAQ